MGETYLINKRKPHHIQLLTKQTRWCWWHRPPAWCQVTVSKQGWLWDQYLGRMRSRESSGLWTQIETTRSQRQSLLNFPLSFCFLQFLSITGEKGSFCGGSKCYKGTLCIRKQAYIWQVLASAEQAVTLEGVDRNAAALSELRGKYWLQRPFFVPREKSIFQSTSHRQAFRWAFFFLFFFHVGCSYVKQAQSDPWKTG